MQPRNRWFLAVLGAAVTAAGLLSCASNSDRIDAPRPTLAGIQPNLVCPAASARDLALGGSGLSPLLLDIASGDARVELPHVFVLRVQDLEGGPVPGAAAIEVPADEVRWQSRELLTPTVTPELGLEPGLYDVRVVNGSGHGTDLPGALTVVPPPIVRAILPSPTCVAQGERAYRLTGTGFVVIGDLYPDVLFDGGATVVRADAAEDCAALPGQPDTVRLCRTLALTVARDGLTVGVRDVTVRNPAATDCVSLDGVPLLVVPPPTLTDVEPDLLCVAQAAQPLVLSGTGFLDVDGVLPTVAVGAATLSATALDDCTTLPGAPVAVRSCGTLHVTLPEGAVEPGELTVTVTNPPQADCASVEPVTVRVVPPPAVTAVVPDLLCLAQGEQTLTVSGSGFLRVDDALPLVTVGGVALGATSASDCEALSGSKRAVETCTALVVTLPQGAVVPGAHEVVVTNPTPAGCASEEVVTVLTVPEPTVVAVDPDLLCLEQAGATVTLTGTGFLEVDGVLPTVAIGALAVAATAIGDCEAATGSLLAVRSCTTLAFELPQEALPAGLHAVRVTNPAPAGCHSEEDARLRVVPPPAVAVVAPDLLCVAAGETHVTLSGSGFLSVAGVLPDVTIGAETFRASAVDDCEPLEGPAAETRTCASVVVTVPEGGLVEGMYAVHVTNPPPADCTSEEEVTLAVTPPPVVAGVTPLVFCDDEVDTTLTVSGAGFLAVGEARPTVTVGGTAYPAATDGCEPVAGTTLTALTCATLTFTLPRGGLEGGWHDLSVTNPLPAACSGGAPGALYALSQPGVARVGSIEPCDPEPTTLRLEGTGFTVVGGVRPAVTVETVAATVDGAGGCEVVEGTDVQVCTSLDVTIPAGTVGPGDYDVTLANPGDHACAVATSGFIGDPPQVESVDPPRLCETGGTITVAGLGFFPGALVLLGENPLPTTFVDAQTLTAVLDGSLAPALFDVTVRNPDGCSGTLVGAFEIEPLPVLFFVDPPVVWNGINVQVKIYASGLISTVTEVRLFPAGRPQDGEPLEFTVDPAEPNRIQAVVPAGLEPGAYVLGVEDEVGCYAELTGALTVVEDVTLAIDRVELPFGWTASSTGVNVYAPASPPDGMVNFAATPRFYLSPAEVGPDALATELRFTAFVSAQRVSATIRAGLPVGSYHLVAVNPTGEVGYLPDAFRVTELPPPVVSDLSPTSVTNQGVAPLAILGDHFEDPVVTLTCLQPNDTVVTPSIRVDGFDAQTIDAALDFSLAGNSLAGGSVCLVRVTNADGTYYDYSALGVTNPSLNLTSFDATAPMVLPRRALCAVAGAAAPGARYVYALGGDDGGGQDTGAATRFDSVEFAAIDPYGDLAPWAIQPYALPVPLSFHGCASLGRFLYVVGGNDGVGAADAVYRAKILDPQQAPVITDVSLDVLPEEDPVLAAGLYSYRVSAVLPAEHPENPGGETLAGDAFLLQTPDIPARLTVTLTWSEVAGAVAYRIYRTPEPGQVSGNERLLAEVPPDERSFTDDGEVLPADEVPLPFGATGRFAVLPSLNEAREGAGVALSADPLDDRTWYLYLLGGRDDTGTALDSVEWLTITLEDDGSQGVSETWTPGSASIGTPRWQLKGFVGNALMAPRTIPDGTVWIYAGGGINGNLSALLNDVVALRVAPGGALGEGPDERWRVTGMQPFRAGYAGSLFNDQIFVFGGSQGTPDANGSSVQICTNNIGACGGGPPGAPDLANWNNLGLAMTHARYLPGDVVVSAFVFLLGGVEGTIPPWVPLADTEKTLW
jgi:hypothetical protein